MRVIRFLAVVPLTVWAVHCASSSPETEVTGTISEALEAGTVVTISGGTQEPSSCWSPPSAGREILCTSSNSTQWAWSPNGGQTWTPCSLGSTSCNGTDAGVDAGAGWSFIGDTTVVSDHRTDLPRGSHVVFVTLTDDGTSGTKGGRRVVALVSNDSGQTFLPQSLTQVNDGVCGDSVQDQPGATFDYTTSPPTLWVVWRHFGPNAYGGCVRRGYVGNDDAIHWLDTSRSVDHMSTEVAFNGQGGMRVVAGDGAVTVLYANNKVIKCPTNNTDSVAIESVTSIDDGETWFQHTRLFKTTDWHSCVAAGTVEDRNRIFDVVRASEGTLYVAAQSDKSSIRLFHQSYGPQVPCTLLVERLASQPDEHLGHGDAHGRLHAER